ncbi:hypothetical protein AKJ44_02505 [candidate division MSBL1 archaeon SCGC-AAA261F17]|uniref:Uncharacterized protein n=1 Tax=candidate division MSBL1 archaeon SCGC-AAA261F17 TaxID=1698274 RepID=A0A133V4U0_9EURY|nr:hypothetical protein AKJ44_02505 [candidate division MSBL1 archaeon SCGC-AAA261F17]
MIAPSCRLNIDRFFKVFHWRTRDGDPWIVINFSTGRFSAYNPLFPMRLTEENRSEEGFVSGERTRLNCVVNQKRIGEN